VQRQEVKALGVLKVAAAQMLLRRGVNPSVINAALTVDVKTAGVALAKLAGYKDWAALFGRGAAGAAVGAGTLPYTGDLVGFPPDRTDPNVNWWRTLGGANAGAYLGFRGKGLLAARTGLGRLDAFATLPAALATPEVFAGTRKLFPTLKNIIDGITDFQTTVRLPAKDQINRLGRAIGEQPEVVAEGKRTLNQVLAELAPVTGGAVGGLAGSGLGWLAGAGLGNLVSPLSSVNYATLSNEEYRKRRKKERMHLAASITGSVLGGIGGGWAGMKYLPGLFMPSPSTVADKVVDSASQALRDSAPEVLEMRKREEIGASAREIIAARANPNYNQELLRKKEEAHAALANPPKKAADKQAEGKLSYFAKLLAGGVGGAVAIPASSQLVERVPLPFVGIQDQDQVATNVANKAQPGNIRYKEPERFLGPNFGAQDELGVVGLRRNAAIAGTVIADILARGKLRTWQGLGIPLALAAPAVLASGGQGVRSTTRLLESKAQSGLALLQAVTDAKAGVKAVGKEFGDVIKPNVEAARNALFESARPAIGGLAGGLAGSGLGWLAGEGLSNLLLPPGNADKSKLDERGYLARRRRERMALLSGIVGSTLTGIGGSWLGAKYLPAVMADAGKANTKTASMAWSAAGLAASIVTILAGKAAMLAGGATGKAEGLREAAQAAAQKAREAPPPVPWSSDPAVLGTLAAGAALPLAGYGIYNYANAKEIAEKKKRKKVAETATGYLGNTWQGLKDPAVRAEALDGTLLALLARTTLGAGTGYGIHRALEQFEPEILGSKRHSGRGRLLAAIGGAGAGAARTATSILETAQRLQQAKSQTGNK